MLRCTRWLALFAVAASLTGLAACGGDDDSGGGGSSASELTDTKDLPPANISFLAFESPTVTKQLWNSVIDGVQKELPQVDVKLLFTPTLDRQKYAKQLQSTGQLPDVTFDVPALEFSRIGAIAPYPTSLVRENFDVPKGLGTIDGKYYGVPSGGQILPLVFYNKQLFAKHGVDVPTNWAEFEQAAAKLKRAGVTPMAVAGGGASFSTTVLLDGIISTDVYGKDPDWLGKRGDDQVSFTDPEFVAALEKWKGLNDAGYFNDDALSVDYEQGQEKFLSGEVAMYPMGSWAAALEGKGFDIGVFPLPTESGELVLPKVITFLWAVSADSRFKRQAQAWAVKFATNRTFATSFLKSDATFPVQKGYEMPTAIAPLISESYDVWADRAAKTVPTFGWEAGDAAAVSGFNDAFNKEAQKLLLGNSASDVAERLDSTWEELNKR